MVTFLEYRCFNVMFHMIIKRALPVGV